MDTAYFVKYPRTIDDLRKPHLLSQERSYEIVSRVTLAAIDYENFITDMVADRQYVEDAAPLCAMGATMRCLLVRQRGKSDGILVVPEGAFVMWAANCHHAPARTAPAYSFRADCIETSGTQSP